MGVCVVLALGACTPQPPPAASEIQAPAFTLEALEGEVMALDDLRGRVVVVHFGTSWCPFCRAEDPHLEALHRVYRERGVQTLVINVGESDADAAQWRDEAGFSFPMLMDRDGAVAASYAPPDAQPDLDRADVMVAANLIIDRTGRVRFMSLLDTQAFDAELVALRERLDEVLAEAPSDSSHGHAEV